MTSRPRWTDEVLKKCITCKTRKIFKTCISIVGIRRQAVQGRAGFGHGDRRRGREDPRSHEEHCPHPPRPERHHQGQSQDHLALHSIQKW